MLKRLKLVLLVSLLTAACGSKSSPIAPSAPLFTKAGTGDSVFDLPASVARVRVTGSYSQNSSNFIVWISGKLIVNELLGTGWGKTTYEGTLLTGGGTVVSIEKSSGVAWSFTEVR